MRTTIVGDPSLFAIESGVTKYIENQGQLALGFFIIHVGGKSYGVREDDATLLGCSYGAVLRRLERRGLHIAPFSSEKDASTLVHAYCAATYDLEADESRYLGQSARELTEIFVSNEISWAPDGDSAFDDGGNVLQFDQDAMVRLVAFRNVGDRAAVFRTIADVWLDADEYYSVLKQWLRAFDEERQSHRQS